MLFGDTYYKSFYTGPSKVDVDVNVGPVTVTENRAPTDESIKLLTEMHHNVIKNIIGRVKTDDNVFHASGMMYRDNMDWCYKVITKYTINSQERVVITNLDEFEIQDVKKSMDKIISAVTNDFAQMVVGQSFTQYWHDLCMAANKGK